jgi:hypothetical protein
MVDRIQYQVFIEDIESGHRATSPATLDRIANLAGGERLAHSNSKNIKVGKEMRSGLLATLAFNDAYAINIFRDKLEENGSTYNYRCIWEENF